VSAGIASPRSSLGESIGINPNSHVFSTCFSAGASRGSIQNKAAARESNLHIREKRIRFRPIYFSSLGTGAGWFAPSGSHPAATSQSSNGAASAHALCGRCEAGRSLRATSVFRF
jgi:hypothetical protein